jgi:TPP-dependent pyruvate/acetoin dehydrogenase alpha subunit
VDAKLKQSPLGRDCLKVAEELAIQELAGPAALAAWRSEAVQKIEQAVAQVQREPGPDPFKEVWSAHFLPRSQ